MRKLTKALTVVSLLAPVSGHSLGIGDIRVRSALNQNLNAEIALVASKDEDPANIKVSLAPAQKFDEAGVPWTYFLSKIKFTPVVKSNGSIVIKVTSREALKEPFLNFLLEVSWPKGNLYREFTVLVDPPAEYEQQTYQEPQYQEPVYPSGGYDNYSQRRQDYVPRKRTIRHRVAKPKRVSIARASYGGQVVTRRNDTLWQVAARSKDSSVTVEQMMVALYEKNPQAFYQQNLNALDAGKRLQVPDKAYVQQTSHEEALAEFGRHNEAWNGNRAAVPAREVQQVKQEVVESQLKLEAPGESTVTANEQISSSSSGQTTGAKPSQPEQTSVSSTPENQPQASTAKDSAPINDAVQSKIAALEKQMAMMQELIALKDKQLADLQNPTKTATPTPHATPTQVAPQNPPVATPAHAEPEPVAQNPPKVTPVPDKPVQTVTLAPPKPVVTPEVKKVEPPPAPTVVEEPVSPLLWVLGGLSAILLPLFGWIAWQKKKIVQETEAESMFRNYSSIQKGDSSALFAAARKGIAASSLSTGEESSFLNDFKASDFESFESFNVDHGDIDPVAEADVYLAYGRYQQAEDLMRQAIKDHPERDDCKLKLLEIFQVSSSKEEFENYALQLVVDGKRESKDFWTKVCVMGQIVSPDFELFSSLTPSDTAVFSTDSESHGENILLSPSAEKVSTSIPTVDHDSMGAANFESTDFDEFSEPAPQASKPTTLEKHSDVSNPVVMTEEEAFDDEDYFDQLGKDDFVEEKNNDSLDFDLGDFAEKSAKVEFNTGTPEAITSAKKKTIPELTLDNLDDDNAIESYSIDFNTQPAKSEKLELTLDNSAKEWDAEQTLDFSLDDNELSSSKDIFGKDILDFSFDIDSPPPDLANKSNDIENQGFRVSDLTDMDEMETKLDLAKAYIDMGDTESAIGIIKQVVEKGSEEQKTIAKLLLDDLS